MDNEITLNPAIQPIILNITPPNGKKLEEIIPDKEYQRLLSFCLIRPEGGYWYILNNTNTRITGNTTYVFYLHPSHLAGATRLFNRLKVEPYIKIIRNPIATTEAKTGDKQKMPLTFRVVENGISVTDKNSTHFVPIRSVSIMLGIFKENSQAHFISPRALWSELAEAHQLFPEFKEMEQYLARKTDIDQTRKDRWIGALRERKSSSFEGLRVRRKEGSIDYYSAYWYVAIILKKIGLLEQVKPNRDLFLTDEGKHFIAEHENLDDWLEYMVAKD